VIVTSADGVRLAIRSHMKDHRRYSILMAEHLGVSQKHLSQMMTGKANISLRNLFAMLEYLDLTLVLKP
jgi:transcriptional regulator with XRE-family HTH domain